MNTYSSFLWNNTLHLLRNNFLRLDFSSFQTSFPLLSSIALFCLLFYDFCFSKLWLFAARFFILKKKRDIEAIGERYHCEFLQKFTIQFWEKCLFAMIWVHQSFNLNGMRTNRGVEKFNLKLVLTKQKVQNCNKQAVLLLWYPKFTFCQRNLKLEWTSKVYGT